MRSLSGAEADERGALVVVRVLLPLWLVLGHNILYVTVGLVWIYLAEYGAKRTISYHPARP